MVFARNLEGPFLSTKDVFDLSSLFSYASALFCAMGPSQPLSHQSLAHSFPCNGGRGYLEKNPPPVLRIFFQVTYTVSPLFLALTKTAGGTLFLPKVEPSTPLSCYLLTSLFAKCYNPPTGFTHISCSPEAPNASPRLDPVVRHTGALRRHSRVIRSRDFAGASRQRRARESEARRSARWSCSANDRIRQLASPRLDQKCASPGVLRPGPAPDLRLQSRRSGTFVRARGRTRPQAGHGVLGRGRSRRPELQRPCQRRPLQAGARSHRESRVACRGRFRKR